MGGGRVCSAPLPPPPLLPGHLCLRVSVCDCAQRGVCVCVCMCVCVCVCNSWDSLGQCCVAVCMLSIIFCVMATTQVECIWCSWTHCGCV